MYSNYPAGSMRGSGIYETEYDSTEFCSHCENEVETTVTVDDFGNAAWDCPLCGEQTEVDPDDGADDFDYDSARDEAMMDAYYFD